MEDDDRTASLDIWLVRVLRTLLLERSVTQAALRLNQTQPAISTALRKLHETLNDPILVRGKSGMVPTEYGASLLEAAQRALREVDFIATPHGAFDPAAARRTFRIAAPDYLNDFSAPSLGPTGLCSLVSSAAAPVKPGIPCTPLQGRFSPLGALFPAGISWIALPRPVDLLRLTDC